jgi:hypothetical protein
LKLLIGYIGLFLLVQSALPSSAQLKLTRVSVNGKDLPVSENPIQMKAGEDDLLLEFSPASGDSVSYMYRLEGGEEQWTSSAYPVARFQALDGGSYIFKIKARTKAAGLVHGEVRIVKKRAFWSEWWFIPLLIVYVLVLIGVGIYLFFLYDFRQKLRMQSVRNQIAADLHDEVGSNLNSIAIFVEILRKNAPADMLPILEKIIANSRESVSLMQDTVWTINPKNDSIHKLFERMNSFASQLLASRDIAFDFRINADLRKVTFTMDQRKSVYLIFKEAINNIVKHAEASKVSIQVDWAKDNLNIVIEDNGKGFNTFEEFEGNGLVNFRERAREADIGLMIESDRGLGTRIRMLV